MSQTMDSLGPPFPLSVLSARIAEEPTAQFGEHDYDIADYGLTEAQIQNTFADYRRRFAV